jgi:ApbE superfamily uncharacterized protein (UPF0280 family)
MPRQEGIARFYRDWMRPAGLVTFQVTDRESDLFIAADEDLTETARKILRDVRKPLEDYVAKDGRFLTALEPYKPQREAPAIARSMAHAGEVAGVGPMAAVAGAIAEAVGRALMPRTKEVIVENGGDIFLLTRQPRLIAVYAGEKSFRNKLGIELPERKEGIGIATSSGTLSASFSMGKADAATVIAETAALADACATALGNRIAGPNDLKAAVQWCASLPGVKGALAIIGDALAVEGEGFRLAKL